MHLLGSCCAHFFVDDVLDFAPDPKAQWQPGENTWRLTPDISGADEPFVACDLRVSWVFAKSANKEVGQALEHCPRLPGASR